MPSLAESRQQVNASLQDELNHEDILVSLQDEIDRHNAVKDDLKNEIRRSKRSRSDTDKSRSHERSSKFRFKGGVEDPRASRKRHRSSKYDGHRHTRSKPARTPSSDDEVVHPFPREPADPETVDRDTFRASLFDALADDEGAAAYWESVYSQPIHVYPRPAVQDARTGKLEQMSDEEYVAYVKEKMWEKKNPEIVRERERKDKERKEEEEERTRKREEFVRRKERAAWERSQRWKGDDDEEVDEERERYEYAFAGDVPESTKTRSRSGESEAEYSNAWAAYLSAWERLLESLPLESTATPFSRIPWPVLPGKPVLKPNIEAFISHAPATESSERLRTLKAERVRWHPDKVQQRFGGMVDEGAMKLVTGVFQVIDGIVEVERKRYSIS